MTVTSMAARRARLSTIALAIAILAIGLVGAPAAPASAAPQFRDVPASHQFYDEITWLAQMKVTTGYADGTFKPSDAVSREAFAAFLYRLVGSPQVTLPSRSPFDDVPRSAQFYKEIVWLSQEGISTGWADGTFRPKDNISREAIAAFLYRLAGKPSHTAPSTSPFADMARSSKFYREVTWLAQTGITTGYADRTFRPASPVQRQAIAAFLYRGSAALHGSPDRYYAVGSGVFPGTYVSRTADTSAKYPWCAWERHRDGDGSWHGLIIASSREGRTIATIRPSDGFFLSSNCTDWVPLRATSPTATSFGDGTSAVGYHMRPGTYTTTSDDYCAYETFSSFASGYDDIIDEDDSAKGVLQVRLLAGQGIWTDGCGTWKRIGN
jgi:hypothetical protein